MNSEINDKLNRAVEIQIQMKSLKDELATLSADIESECLRIVMDRNVKSTVVYGENGNKVMVTQPTKVELIDSSRLFSVLTKDLSEAHVKRTESVTYTLTDSMKRLLSVVKLKEYDRSQTLAQFVDLAFKQADSKNKALLLKKLKGQYLPDRKLLVSLFGENDWDVELFDIYRICNWDFVCTFFGGEPTSEQLDILSRVAIVDENVKIEYDYVGKK